MASKHRHRRGRFGPPGTTPEGGRHLHVVRPRPDLLDEVATRLDEPPFSLLAYVSTLVEALDPAELGRPGLDRRDGAERPSLAAMVTMLADVGGREPAALLSCLAALAPDELVRAAARHGALECGEVPPGWVRALGAARATRTMVLADPLGDGEDVLIEVRFGEGGGEHALSVLAYVDHNLGSAVKDAFVAPVPLDEIIAELTAGDVQLLAEDLDPAAARARLEAAIEEERLLFPPIETETWPQSRALIAWACRLLPPGGAGYCHRQWSEPELTELIETFWSSPEAAGLDPDDRGLFEVIIGLACAYGTCDPLHWSPAGVEIMLCDLIPRKVLAPEGELLKVPELLRALIAHAHRRRKVPGDLTRSTLAALGELESEFRRELADVRSRRPPGLAAVADFLSGEDGSPDAERFAAMLSGDSGAMIRADLARQVGGAERLARLDDAALPDEAFSYAGIAEDICERVGEVLAEVDRCCDALLDRECRTACRRLLARAALGDPAVFRRKARSDIAAAALCWVIAKGNDLLSASSGGLSAKGLLAHFNLSGSVSQRAATLLKAAGITPPGDALASFDLALGDPALLVSSHRRHLIELAERYGATED
ncbi:MAG: DUF6398 domain-containing protein [Actinomycetota bacterium]|nr:DUF6398 domain-containing protein [Actinomycetota bacterium]